MVTKFIRSYFVYKIFLSTPMKLSPWQQSSYRSRSRGTETMFLLGYEVTDEMSKYCISWIGGEDKKWVKYEENKSGSPDL